MNQIKLPLTLLLGAVAVLVAFVPDKKPVETPRVVVSAPVVVQTKPSVYNITTVFPSKYLEYSALVDQLKEWNKQAPEITELKEYGRTKDNTPCYYLRVGTPGKPKLLIHAGIHGNERLCVAAKMGMIGQYLYDYGRNEEVTWLVNNRDIYFVPAMSPDTYLNARHVEGVDPNRSYPCPARPEGYPPTPVKLIMDLTKQHQFKAVISSHTFGRIYLTPSLTPRSGSEGIVSLANKMASMSGYRVGSVGSSGRGNGYDVDWYYMQNACAILVEWGNGPRHEMSYSEVKPELDRNYKAFLLFFKEAPEVAINYKADDSRPLINPRRRLLFPN